MERMINKLSKAFKYSWSGLKYAWHTQWAFRVEILILIVALPIAWYLSHAAVEFILLVCSIIVLSMMELINAAIETTLNRVGMEYHELTKFAKDMASAAIFIAGINVFITWGVIFITNFF